MLLPPVLSAIGTFFMVTTSRVAAVVAGKKLTDISRKDKPSISQNKSELSKSDKQLQTAEAKYFRERANREQEFLKIQADLTKIREIEVKANMEIAIAQEEHEERALEISEQELELKKEALQLSRERLKLESCTAQAQQRQAEYALQLQERELQILLEEQVERRRLSYLNLQLVQQNKAKELDLKLKEIQARWDQENWSGILSRDEMRHILVEGQKKHRLLMLVSPPDIEDCPEFDSSLHKAVRSELKEFMERNYPLNSDLCPVEFYGKFFKSSVFDVEVKQYEKDLSLIPTVVIYSDITHEKVYFHIHFWGLSETITLTLPWNWLEEMNRLETENGKMRDESLRIIQSSIVKIHQLLAAFFADLYYLQINPVHDVQLFQLDNDLSSEWIWQHFKVLRLIQQEQLEKRREILESPDFQPINLFFN